MRRIPYGRTVRDMTRAGPAWAAAIVLLLVSVSAEAALTAYLSLATKAGPIHGSVTQKGREKKIAVHGISHQLQASLDASGRPLSKPPQGPLVIRKLLDASSPLLHRAFAHQEVMTAFELQLHRQGATGIEEQHYTIRLTKAKVASIHTIMPDNKDPSLAQRETYEDVGFTYETITWTWNNGPITASASWTDR